jgi:ryanodine receptor 2
VLFFLLINVSCKERRATNEYNCVTSPYSLSYKYRLDNFVFILCIGEACWWTVHPASKQRSEGEKVRVGDDLILVSVATERYLVSYSVVGLL